MRTTPPSSNSPPTSKWRSAADPAPDPDAKWPRGRLGPTPPAPGPPRPKSAPSPADPGRPSTPPRREIATYRKAQNEHATQPRMTAARDEALRRRAENE